MLNQDWPQCWLMVILIPGLICASVPQLALLRKRASLKFGDAVRLYCV